MAPVMAQTFDPVAVLGLINPDRDAITCVGDAPTQGRRCRNPIARHNRDLGVQMLRGLPLGLSKSEQLQDELEEAASYLLCRRYHQDQADIIANGWFRTIRNHTIRNQHTSLVNKATASIGPVSRHGGVQAGPSRLAQVESARPSTKSITATTVPNKAVSPPETQRKIEAAQPRPNKNEPTSTVAHRQLAAVDSKAPQQSISGNDKEVCHHHERKDTKSLSAEYQKSADRSPTTCSSTDNATNSCGDSKDPELGGVSRPAQALPPLSSGTLSLVSASSDNASDGAVTARLDAGEHEDWQDLDFTPEPSDVDESDLDETYNSDEEMEEADQQLQNEDEDYEHALSLQRTLQENERQGIESKGKQPATTPEPSTPAPRQSVGRRGYRPSTSPACSTPAKADWGAEWSRYESSWAALARQDASTIQGSLLHTLPWPVAGGKPRDVTEASVEDFFSIAPGAIVDDDAAYARMLRRHALRWRPERLLDRFGDEKVNQQGKLSRLVKLVHEVVSSLV